MVMKKFMNAPENLTTELLEGYALCYPSKIKVVSEKIVVRATPKSTDKVAIVTLGGAGHEPALSGFVGEGMLDASVVGDIFAAPGAPKVVEALRMFKDYKGIILVVLNHEGDQRNANMALMMAATEGLKVSKIVTAEDIAPGVDAPIEDRRGLGGCIPLIKILGAAAEKGLDVDEILAIGERFNKRMATLAVTLKVATHPQAGQEIGALADDQMEIGMGQHGEGGGNGPEPMQSADWVAETMANKLARALELKAGEKIMLMINGSGATTLMEMLIVYRKAHQVLTAAGIEVVSGCCDEILTVQEAAGFQMIVGVFDDETLAMYNAPSDAPYWVVR
ncbi:MAG: dihydroxyacetone kinase subunit DhaK, partial [Thermoguttaceae bacterium]|nr:dihydroxyacetone kinase subunit DhaK [Thermoguttaceae bacterium]